MNPAEILKLPPFPWIYDDKSAVIFDSQENPLLIIFEDAELSSPEYLDQHDRIASFCATAPQLYEACVAMLATWGSKDEQAIIAARKKAVEAVQAAYHAAGGES